MPENSNIFVGTCGYSYTEWISAGFYPPGTSSGAMLAHYAKSFMATELNYTWYQMPKARSLEGMLKQAPAGFLFSAKLNRRLTHEIEPDQWRGHAAQFRENIAPLVQSNQLAAVLVQFPPSFERSQGSRIYLDALLSELDGLPLAVEFRHVSWANDKVFAGLERRRVTLVSVDAPALSWLFPPLAVVTNPDFFYVRFHGRNLKGWSSGSMQQQFNYDYSEDELCQWTEEKIPEMAAKAGRGFVFFNNHVRAQAPKNAGQIASLLYRQGLVAKA